MLYSKFAELYDKVALTTKKLEKTEILSDFLKVLDSEGESEWIYLLRGRVLPDFDSREFGISDQLVLKAISVSFGVKSEEVLLRFKKIGDLGEVCEHYASKRRQSTLFSKKLEAKKLFSNLKEILDIEGKGAVDKKMQLVSEVLSYASEKEAKYIVRTLLSDLRVGVADALLVDALNLAFFENKEGMKEILEEKYDLCNDFALLFDSCKKGEAGLKQIDLKPGRPIKVMLAVKAGSLEEGFEAVGKPCAIEHKYDGFRMIISKERDKISLFTRKLENVTTQFPDVVSAIRENILGENFILDSEVVGYDSKTKKYLPFESISQRIRRKYEIEKLVSELPVEINVFDVVYHNGKNMMQMPFVKRREKVVDIVKEKKLVIRPAVQIITEDFSEAEKFYNDALKIGEEGVMMKSLSAPYKQGRKVGYMVKMKPIVNDLDLVIVGAEYGTGKRAGWLTSFLVGCRENDSIVELGMVSSGLKEKEEEGTTYEEVTKLLKPLVVSEEKNFVKVKPKLVVSVTYQNIQKSTAYSSGYALRFPRISYFRPDRSIYDIASIEDIEREVKKQR